MSQQGIAEGGDNYVAGFIAKTYEILSNDEYAKIIHWSPSGKQFVIKDANKFQEIVLPHYFRHRKINSFVRQLNMYGFHKSRKDNSKCIFSHPNFLKDREDLLITIKRKIKQAESDVKTPYKESEGQISKLEERTCAKDQKESKKANQESEPMLTGFLDSKNYINSSFVNLNTSLRKLSNNDLDLPEVNQNDNQLQNDEASIQEEINRQEGANKEKPIIVNPSFFFCTFKSTN